MAKTTTRNVVTGALASLVIEGVVITVPHGGVLPKATPSETVEHLIAVGLVKAEKVQEEAADTAETAGGQVEEIPQGDPTADWTVKQLTAYAKEHDIDVSSAKGGKPDLVALVVKPAAPTPDAGL